MRNHLRSSLFAAALAALALGAGACKWTDFDDLKEDTWVTATGSPDNAATSWGVSIARVARSGQPARLAVLGASEPVYNDVVIGPNGDIQITSELEINPQFVTGNLPTEPLLLSNPDGDDAALVTGVTDGRITVIRSINGQLSQLLVNKTNMQPTGATYLKPPTGDTQIVVAQNKTVFGVLFAPTPGFDQQKCDLRDEANADANVRALGAYRPAGAASDDLLVFTESGKLLIYSGGPAFAGCGTMAIAPVGNRAFDTMFTGAVAGSQIIPFVDGTTQYFLLEAHADGGRGHLGLYKIENATITAVGAPRGEGGLRSAALMPPRTPGGKRYVIAGYPQDIVEGVTAGQVRVFELDLASGIAASPATTLHDAQPEDRQQFGRAVAALPFNGTHIIAVGADNDVFLYFRSPLYDETRQGR